MQNNTLVLLTMTLGLTLLAPAQVKTEIPPVEPGAKPVNVEQIKIHGASLEGNLEGEDVDRTALVFLPPTSATAKSRRYPVVYALHGYSIGAEQWSHARRAGQPRVAGLARPPAHLAERAYAAELMHAERAHASVRAGLEPARERIEARP